MMLPCAGKLARLLPLLGSPSDGEALGAARAIGRVLQASGADFHMLAAELQQPTALPAARARRDRTPRVAPLSAEALCLLQAGLQLDCFSAWEMNFATTILQAAGRPGWRPSRKQSDIAARLVSKASEAEAHP